MKLTHHDQDGKELAILSFAQDFERKYSMQQFCSEAVRDTLPAKIWIDLICKGLEEATRVDAKEVAFRLVETPNSNEVSEKLSQLGFERGLDRIEFRAQLSALPSEGGTPLLWQCLDPHGPWSLRQAADLLRMVSMGDPNVDPAVDPLTELLADLKDPVLTGGSECVEIGIMDGHPVSVVVAQINPRSKWSRITYMGLAPSHRGTGLGTWIHRHGFEMLRRQGGTLYHGGTTSNNEAMLKLFATNHCPVYRRMQQWTLIRN